jgi:hypothetical protein
MSVVAKEVAEEEFARLCDALDLDLEGFDDDEQEKFDGIKHDVVRAIERGRVTVDQEGQVTIQLKRPVGEVGAITFTRPTGASLMAIGDSRKKNEVEKLLLLMADLSGQPSVVFTRMDYLADGKLCQKVVSLFLG